MKTTSKPRRFVRLFQTRFAEAVRTGAKTQTVRATPKRMPAAGDIIDLRTWSGAPYRSKQTHLGLGRIEMVAPVQIDTQGITIGATLLVPSNAHHFARLDGFTDEQELLKWFDATHGLPFTGILILWTIP